MAINERIVSGDFITDELGVSRQINRYFGAPAGAGDNVLVAARGAGIRIRVLAAFQVTTLANTVHFRSAATPISPALPLAANGGIVLPFNPSGWFQTAANEALNLNNSAATAVGTYVEWVEAD